MTVESLIKELQKLSLDRRIYSGIGIKNNEVERLAAVEFVHQMVLDDSFSAVVLIGKLI